jgi:lipoprotein-releasing system ATP-binding protein
MSPSKIIEVSQVTKSFIMGGKQLHVLRGVDFTVEAGDAIAIVGASGVGKSTLLNIIGTIERPTSGNLLYEGKDITGMSDAALAAFRNRFVGFVFQFHHLLPEFNAVENAMMPLLIGGSSRKQAQIKAEELLEAVGLSDRLHHKPGELSGGEQQRVAVARALIQEPKVLLADEPTGNLDPETGAGVENLLLDFNRRLGITLLVVTHNLQLAETLGRTVRLADGKIV